MALSSGDQLGFDGWLVVEVDSSSGASPGPSLSSDDGAVVVPMRAREISATLDVGAGLAEVIETLRLGLTVQSRPASPFLHPPELQ